MKNLTALYNTTLNELQNIGIKPGNIMSIAVNNRAKKRWGACKLRDGFFYLEINGRLLQDDVSDNATKNTIAHEILHTCEGAFNHGPEWQRLAEKVNVSYCGQYHIQRTTTAVEKGVESVGQVRCDVPKWALQCRVCGRTYVYKRAGKAVQNPQNYRCGRCGGTLNKFQLD